MTGAEMVPLLEMVREARAELHDGDEGATLRCAKLLRQAEVYADDLPRFVMDEPDALQAVTAVRTELGTCLIASDRLLDAGVAVDVVASVLRRGTLHAERTLVSLVFGPEAAVATF